MAMLLAAVCAKGTKTIDDADRIERGYERIGERLNAPARGLRGCRSERGRRFSRRPCESRDPYAVSPVVKHAVGRHSRNNRPVVMGPCFRRDDEGAVRASKRLTVS